MGFHNIGFERELMNLECHLFISLSLSLSLSLCLSCSLVSEALMQRVVNFKRSSLSDSNVIFCHRFPSENYAERITTASGEVIGGFPSRDDTTKIVVDVNGVLRRRGGKGRFKPCSYHKFRPFYEPGQECFCKHCRKRRKLCIFFLFPTMLSILLDLNSLSG